MKATNHVNVAAERYGSDGRRIEDVFFYVLRSQGKVFITIHKDDKGPNKNYVMSIENFDMIRALVEGE